MHAINSTWQFDGNVDAPTFSPSVLVTSGHYVSTHKPGSACWCTFNEKRIAEGKSTPFKCGRCHTFIKGGMVQFLDDCTHEFAGQTVPLPDLPVSDVS